jgi:hypothetical protein
MARSKDWPLLLAIAPFLGMCFTVPLWDRLYPLIFGIPFNIAWLIAWIPLTSLCLWGVYSHGGAPESEDTSASESEVSE